jgi:stage II sporulation protein D
LFTLSAEQFRVACNSGPGLPLMERNGRLPSNDVEVRIEGRTAVFAGRGFGHGVGGCQYGFEGFASRGEEWGTILARFYPGARPVRLYQ